MRKVSIAAATLVISLVFFMACNHGGSQDSEMVVVEDTTSLGGTALNLGPNKLSEYGFFKGKQADLDPVDGVVPYNLNTPLFSDYAHKQRFIKLPAGQKAVYNDKEVFDYPVGTILIKNFYYPNDFRDESKGRRIIETRLLVHKDSGWIALPYIWNDDQTDASLQVAGGHKDITWVHYDGTQKKLNYAIPNVNQCQNCHNRNEVFSPIGPSARQLNGDYAYATGKENQLDYWIKHDMLTGLTASTTAPKLPVWDDPKTGSLADRARAYLDINCGHCHRPEGTANSSGLFLYVHEKDPAKWGINKPPVAAGRGSSDLHYDIVPGQPDQSILAFRMSSTDPGIMMPELGRKMNHDEGIKLIREWIASLDANNLKKTGNYSKE